MILARCLWIIGFVLTSLVGFARAEPSEDRSQTSEKTQVPPLPTLTNEEWLTLRKGKAVLRDDLTPPSPYAAAHAFVLMHAPIAAAFGIIKNQSLRPRYTDKCKRAELLPGSTKAQVYRFDIQSFPFSPSYHVAFTVEHDEENLKILGFSLDKTRKNDIRGTYGRWILRTVDPKTLPGGAVLLEYLAYIDVGTFIPEALQKRALRKDMPEMLENLRRLIDGGGNTGSEK